MKAAFLYLSNGWCIYTKDRVDRIMHDMEADGFIPMTDSNGYECLVNPDHVMYAKVKDADIGGPSI